LQTFRGLEYWVKELEQSVKEENMIIAIAGNKCDLPQENRRVSEKMGI